MTKVERLAKFLHPEAFFFGATAADRDGCIRRAKIIIDFLQADGWQLAPAEPTEDMLAAVGCGGVFKDGLAARAHVDAYKTMLRAAQAEDR